MARQGDLIPGEGREWRVEGQKREADRNTFFLTFNPRPSTCRESYRQQGARALVSSKLRAYETTACGLIGL